jgi:Domain of unknown function (DUF1833)
MTLTTATLKQAQRTADTGGLRALLELAHPSWPVPIRLAGDTRDWLSNGLTYAKAGFSVTLPADSPSEPVRAQIEIINIGRELSAELEALTAGGVIVATLRLINPATPNVYEFECAAELVGVHATVKAIQGQISNSRKGGRSAVTLRYDPYTTPGLFTQ